MRNLILLGILASPAWACSCSVVGPPCEAVWRADAVFTGTVMEIAEPPRPLPSSGTATQNPAPRGRVSARHGAGDPVPPPRDMMRTVRFRVTEIVTGVDPTQKEIEVATGKGGGDCGYAFQSGEDYVVYAYRLNGRLETGICTRTRPLRDAAEDLAYFHALPSAPPTGEIRIVIRDADRSWQPGSAGLSGVRTSVQGTGGRYQATTDAAGTAKFTGVPAGEYRIEAALEGYTPWSYKIQVHEKGCVEESPYLSIDRRIKGRILTKEGQPASGILVQVVRTHPQDGGLPHPAASAKTDPAGHYELQRISAGDYYLGINPEAAPHPDIPYARWFYPGTEESSQAVIVRFSGVANTQTCDLALPDRQSRRLIEGVVVVADGRAAPGARLFLVNPRVPWGSLDMAGKTDSEGHFQLSSLDGTRYRLYADWSPGSTRESLSSEALEIQPGADILKLRVVLTHPGQFSRAEMNQALERYRKGLGL